jgi:peroxiredoxin
MSGKRARAARTHARASELPARSSGPTKAGFWISWKGGLVALGVIALVAASFVLPGVFNQGTSSQGAQHAMAMGAKQGEGLPAGSAVPAFAERDLLSGRTISSRSLFAQKTLLFFSEGVMCQACFEQIRGLEQFGTALHRRGIKLVSITPDTPGDLEQAARQYGITTPLVSDADRNMSRAFNTLGLGMHADMPGHAFALIDRGKLLWYRDYWLPPARAMYVEPEQLLADLPRA